MPTSLMDFVWIIGSGMIILMLGMLGFFFVRLINGVDSLKKEVTEGIRELNTSMQVIHLEVTEKVGDLSARVLVIEEAGCIAARQGAGHGK